MTTLRELGWDAHFEQHFEAYREKGLLAGRVVRVDGHIHSILTEQGERPAEVAGRMRHHADSRSELPAVGDWVAVRTRAEDESTTIQAVLPRQSHFSRKAPGSPTEEKVVVANVDTVLIVAGLDGEFNVRRIERFLTLARDSQTDPVVVLNKSDLCDDVLGRVAESLAAVPGVPTYATSATAPEGIDALRGYLQPGKTVALLGSSGVGKSSLINAVLGEARQRVGEVHEATGHGRHITTRRELILVPGGGMFIDNPGMREIQVWAEEEALDDTFADIEELVARCRFTDCTHEVEAGCAVREAVEAGDLDAGRVVGYLKLSRELGRLAYARGERFRLDERTKRRRAGQPRRKRGRGPTRSRWKDELNEAPEQ